MQEQLPSDAAVEPTWMYIWRVLEQDIHLLMNSLINR